MIGILFAFNAAIFATLKDIVSKKVSFVSPGTISTIASFFYALPFYAIALIAAALLGYEDWHIGPLFISYVILRAVSDCAAEWMKMLALSYGDLSLISAFYSLSPVFLLFTSPLITGDELSSQGVLGVVLVGIGALVFVINPTKKIEVSFKGISLAIGAAFFFSINSCFDRLAVQQSSPLIAGFSMTLVSGLILLPVAKVPILPAFRVSHQLFIKRGFFEMIFMVSKLIALSFMQAPYVVAIMRSSVLMSIIGGRLVFREKDFVRRLIAGILVLCGVIIILVT